jgi:hypothetical protein
VGEWIGAILSRTASKRRPVMTLLMGGLAIWALGAAQAWSADGRTSNVAAAPPAMTWSGPIRLSTNGNPQVTAVSCPLVSQCTAVDSVGQEVTFAPGSSQQPAPTTVDPGNGVHAVACPSPVQCTAVDDRREVTFDPLSPGTVSRVTLVPADGPMLGDLACPSVSQCTTTDSSGGELTFDPNSVGSATPVSIESNATYDLACPSISQCTALDAVGREVTFDPNSPGSPAPKALGIGSDHPAEGISCPSVSQCTAIDLSSPSAAVREVTFDPNSPGSPTPVVIDAGSATTGPPNAFRRHISCPTVTLCAVTDGDYANAMGGNVREVTFNPTSPGMPVPVIIGESFKFFQFIAALDCPSATECVAVSLSGTEREFDPHSPTADGFGLKIDYVGGGITAVACPARSLCVGVLPYPSLYVPATVVYIVFNPQLPGGFKTTSMLDSEPTGIACPSSRRCVAVTLRGDEGTLNTRSLTRPNSLRIDSRPLAAIACPSMRQCTAVDDQGREVTFNPVAPRRHTTRTVDTGLNLTAVACPVTRQCTAVDNVGREVTFNPETAHGGQARRIDASSAITSVACPSVTECSAVDITGYEVTFDPRARKANARRRLIDPGSAVTTIACGSIAQCVAVDLDGNAVEGNPTVAIPWRRTPISGANSLLSVACSTSAQCVAGDAAGNAWLGTN